MKRRDFLEVSAFASAAIMMGSFTELRNRLSLQDDNNYPDHARRLRMHGGCRDFRTMNDSIPAFFEREIIDGWA
ncbi:MAG: hypothetical protein JSW64_01225 [Candidatus Zixiibacteriota bacterium]|nr:MAG: hypothetical protein JSW64_01225 [candidate division Zixibacteria bacterium]